MKIKETTFNVVSITEWIWCEMVVVKAVTTTVNTRIRFWPPCVYQMLILKGVVHPKMNIIYSFFSNSKPARISIFCWTQKKTFLRMSMPLTFIVLKKITCFQVSSFVFNKRKKVKQVWDNLRMSKWWQYTHFGWTIPLNCYIWTPDCLLKTVEELCNNNIKHWHQDMTNGMTFNGTCWMSSK